MRLTPMYFFLLMFFMHVFPALGDGPDWKVRAEGPPHQHLVSNHATR
jgi:hypothetical protein